MWQSVERNPNGTEAGNTMEPKVYGPGTLAFLDTFSGMVPCRVLSIDEDGAIAIQLTATRGAYKRGETLSRGARSVVPRPHYIRKGHTLGRIVGGYVWRNAS